MKKLIVRSIAASILGGVCSISALAQDPNFGSAPPAGTAPAQGATATDSSNLRGSGRTRSGTWISAVKFTGRLSSTAPQLTYFSNHFYNAPGSAGATGYFAQLDLEPGVAVDMVSCIVDDGSAGNNVSGSLQKYTANLTTKARAGTFLASNGTTGTPGLTWFQLIPSVPETISTHSFVGPDEILTQYYVRVDVSQDTSFAGCWAMWTRQISPAPASASFTDVPTSHFAFQAIEALKASLVTTGCTASTYCPNNNVTRAEMALFLSRALGLNWTF